MSLQCVRAMIHDFIAGPPECVPDPRLVPKPYRGVGRPTKYSEDLVERFLDCIIEGMTVGAALKQDGMPVKQTILNWTKANPEFRRKYDTAIAFRNQCIMDDCIDIADGPQPKGMGSRKTRIAARWKQLSGMASHALRRRRDDAKVMAQDKQHLIENDPVYGKLYEWELEARHRHANGFCEPEAPAVGLEDGPVAGR